MQISSLRSIVVIEKYVFKNVISILNTTIVVMGYPPQIGVEPWSYKFEFKLNRSMLMSFLHNTNFNVDFAWLRRKDTQWNYV